MEENKNDQEQLEEIQEAPVTTEEIPEEIPAAEPAVQEASAEVAEEAVAEAAAEEISAEVPAEPAKKATPGKIAVAVGTVVLLAAVLIALIFSGNQNKEEAPAAESTEVVETVEATIPADGNPEDVTCKGSYSVSDEEVKAAADTVVATIGEHTLTNSQLQV